MIVVAWETTRHCILRCRHCRGSATSQHLENELTTAEGKALIDNLARSFEHSMIILSGGEPMSRPDIWELAEYAVGAGVRTVMSPCGPLITPDSAAKMRDVGLSGISISLDGANAETHDDFRGIPGIFAQTLQGIAHARDAGVRFQINSTISKLNAHQIPETLSLAHELGANALDLFFLVPTGRGKALADLALSAEEHEQTLAQVAQLSKDAPIPIRVTCAPHFVRISAAEGLSPQRGFGSQGCLAGRRFLFVSHRGIVQPCGFLQRPCGDLRAENFDLKKIYDESPHLLALRDTANYKDACGCCPFRERCGGCRARAYEATGDYLAAEPFCQFGETLSC